MLPATICEIIQGYRDGAFSPVDVIEAALRQIERLEPSLNTFVHLDAADRLRDAARRSESRWQKGEPAGALDGVPFTVKDSIRARDWPTRSGSLTTSPAPGDFDAPAVARIREAHAIILGKTTTPELGWKTVTDSPLTGITRNPWNPDMTPGGSSGGSAAGVAAGMAAASLGTDAAGSVRIPSAFCGLVGLKATRGRIPAFPPSSLWTLGHIGPITRSVRDAALLLDILSQPDPRDWNALPPPDGDFRSSLDAPDGDLRGLRIAFSPALGHAKVDPEVANLVAGAVRRLEQRGATIEVIEAPLPDAREGFRTYFATGISHGLRAYRPEQIAQLDPGLAGMLEEGKRVTRLQFLEAYDFQIRLSREARLLHQQFDLLVTPTCAVPPFATGRLAPEGYGDHWLDWASFTYPFNMTGQPALSLCCGYTADGLPVGLQIVGAMYREPTVLRAACALEVEIPSRACYSGSAAS
jgi:aspartyl-tRNA(Asn)/glutamyl-tRNA(Gln) amidotransferase subunit A